MKALPYYLGAVLLLTSLAGYAVACRAPHQSLPTVPQVDLRRYAGQWYEIARLPNAFQRSGENATAEYLPMADGGVKVINTAFRSDGKTRVIRGKATAVPGSHNARLQVRFGGLAALVPVSKEGNYWIVALDQAHYGYAVVGTPDRKFLWILARTPHLDWETAEKLRARAHDLGFATKQLFWDKR